MVHYAGYCPALSPLRFPTRCRDGVGDDWPISYDDMKPHYERLEARVAGRGSTLAMGRSPPIPARPHPIAGGAELAWAGALRGSRCGSAQSGSQRELRQPAALHLPGLLLAGVQSERESLAAGHPLPDAIEHGAEIRADSMVSRAESTRHPAASPACAIVRDGIERAACRRHRDRRLLDRDSAAAPHSTSARFPHGLANEQRSGRPVRDGAGRAADRGTVPDELRMYKAPPPEISSEHFYETDERAGSRGASRSRRSGRSRSTGRARPRRRPLGPGAARVHARLQPLVHARRALRAPAATGEPRHARRRTSPITNGIPVARMDYSQCENDRKNIALAKQTIRDILEAAGAQDILAIDRYAHLVGGCRMGADPGAQRRRRRPSRVGGPEPVHRRWQRDADAGLGQPGADDHGAGLEAGGAARSQAPRRASSVAAAPAPAASAAPSPVPIRWRLSQAWPLRGWACSSKTPWAPSS